MLIHLGEVILKLESQVSRNKPLSIVIKKIPCMLEGHTIPILEAAPLVTGKEH